MVCCLYKRVDYGTLKGHWFLKSNLKIKSTILHIKSITKRVLSVFIIFIKYFSFTNFEGLVVKYAPSFPPARARSSNFFICLLQERIKLYPLSFLIILLGKILSFSSHSKVCYKGYHFDLTCVNVPSFLWRKRWAKGHLSQFFSWGVEVAVSTKKKYTVQKRKKINK